MIKIYFIFVRNASSANSAFDRSFDFIKFVVMFISVDVGMILVVVLGVMLDLNVLLVIKNGEFYC